MTGQSQKFTSQATYFSLDECSVLFLLLSVETVNPLHDQLRLLGDCFHERNLLWCVLPLRTRFDADQRSYPLLLQKERKEQEGLRARRHGVKRRRKRQLLAEAFNRVHLIIRQHDLLVSTQVREGCVRR